MHDLELKEKLCEVHNGLRVKEGTMCQFLLKHPVPLKNFNVASTHYNSELRMTI